MANPLLLFLTRSPGRRTGQRPHVPVPTETPSTDAIFLALRRMRTPMIVIITIFTISVLGLTLVPGVDDEGHTRYLSIFDAFYFVSYTATTIGFGELGTYTTGQRLWVTLTIYSSVVGWAYAIAQMLSLMQDKAFIEAVETQRFRRKVNSIHEPFYIVAGYGQAGSQVCRELDESGRRVVVLDPDDRRIDRLAGDQKHADIPGLEGDASLAGVLGLAGLDRRTCAGVLALTDDDSVNLAIVMAVDLLRPELPVIARCNTRVMQDRMRDFRAAAVVNAGDRFGGYLVLALKQPTTFRLLSWLMDSEDALLRPKREVLARGKWVVCAEGVFRDEVVRDLRQAGQEVVEFDPHRRQPVMKDAVGFIAGMDNDTLNLALAEHARIDSPDVFICVKQLSTANVALVRALQVDTVFTPTDLVATEVLARTITPAFWTFVDHAMSEPEEWAADVLTQIVHRCGRRNPHRDIITIGGSDAPAVQRWVGGGHSLSIDELLHDPFDRSTQVRAMVLQLMRGDEVIVMPPGSTPLQCGDQLLVAAADGALNALTQTLYYDSAVRYVATGERIPEAWVWRVLTRHRRR